MGGYSCRGVIACECCDSGSDTQLGGGDRFEGVGKRNEISGLF